MQSKKIMILGASTLQLPAICKAKEMGITVIAVDKDSNAVGFKYADICLFFSTIDTPRITEAARQFGIDGIMTAASDRPMRAVALAAAELHLAGISEETALRATNKILMRQCLKEHNVPVPAFFGAEDFREYQTIMQRFKTACIVKPADNSGSRGVFKISDPNDRELAKYAYDYSKKSSGNGEIIVEEFMEGPEVSVETISENGAVHIIAVTDKLTSGPPRFVEMGHSQPSRLAAGILGRIKEVAANAVLALGIDNGPAHVEIIATKAGPKVVELGARLGGDYITSHLVPLSTGTDMVKCCIQIALGEKPDFKINKRAGAAIRYFNTPPGKIMDIQNVETAKKSPAVRQITFVKAIGETAPEINSSSDRVGFVIAQSKNAAAAVKACKNALARIRIEIEAQGKAL